MIPTIRVFESDEINIAGFINKFEELGYDVFYDSKNGENPDWFRENIKDIQYRMYCIKGKTLIDYLWENNLRKPLFMIYFPKKDNEVPKYMWHCILRWLQFHLTGVKCADASLIEVNAFLEKTPKLYPIEKSEDIIEKAPLCTCSMADFPHSKHETVEIEPFVLEGEYEFRSLHLEPHDMMIYQVNRPGSPPWTIVVTSFSHKGHKFFFTDIHNSNDFNRSKRECHYDFWFLSEVWIKLNQRGFLTHELLNNMLKTRVEGCYPTASVLSDPTKGPDAEPTVYRKTIEQVVEQLNLGANPNILTQAIALKRKRDE